MDGQPYGGWAEWVPHPPLLQLCWLRGLSTSHACSAIFSAGRHAAVPSPFPHACLVVFPPALLHATRSMLWPESYSPTACCDAPCPAQTLAASGTCPTPPTPGWAWTAATLAPLAPAQQAQRRRRPTPSGAAAGAPPPPAQRPLTTLRPSGGWAVGAGLGGRGSPALKECS